MTSGIRDQEFSLPQGFTLGGRYQIQRELGRGGIGIVYLAADEQLLSRQVVVKVIHDHYFRNEWVERKFRHEMEALSRIDHPGVVSVLDAGQIEDGKPYLIMQYIDGILLRSLITRQGMNFERASNLLMQIGDALEAAHSKGVLHRDLKPENIMVQELGDGKDQIKLIDFGLAKVMQSRTSNSTAMPVVAGSFGYMSPEQLSAKPVTQASDIYSLAVIAYEMIAGCRPYEPQSVFELYHLQQKGLTKKPRTIRKDLSEIAELVLLKALSFDPIDRQQSAREFTEQLSGALEGRILTLPFPPLASFQEEQTPSFRLFPWFTSLLFLFGISIALKTWVFRFSDWTSFLTSSFIVFTLYPLFLLLILGPFLSLLHPSMRILAAFFRALFLRRTGNTRFGVIVSVLTAAILSCGSLLLIQPVISISSIPGSSVSTKDFFLNYSDPKGYKYTIENRTYLVHLNPGGWNQLRDYSIEIILSPEIEFADLYLDRSFQLFHQLRLQPSSTNDVLKMEKTGDRFIVQREIAFTCKYRQEPVDKRVRVTIKSPGAEFFYEKNIP